MSQHDFNIANQGFPSFRTDLNNALVALATTSSGTAEPATTYANQLWYETDTNILHIRNEANSAWLDLMVIDQTTGSPSFTAGNVGIGTASPSAKLDVIGTSGSIVAELQVGANDDVALNFRNAAGTQVGYITSHVDSITLDGDFTKFSTGGTERMRIDSSGNVGIGTASPTSPLHVYLTDATTYGAGTAALDTTNILRVQNGSQVNDTYSGIQLLSENGAGTPGMWTIASVSTSSNYDNHLVFHTRTGSTTYAERMRITSDGDLLVGKNGTNTANVGCEFRANGVITGTVDGGAVAFFNRTTSDGPVVSFRKDNTTLGSIEAFNGAFCLAGITATGPQVKIMNNTTSVLTLGAYASASQYGYIGDESGGAVGVAFVNVGLLPVTANDGALADNTFDIGGATGRWDDIYATNNVIQTSDRNEKQDIEELNDAERRVAVACKGLLRKYRWISSVAEKGDDARIHFGIIAQDLQAAFAAEGLDAGRYAMFISSTWWEHDGKIYDTAEEAPEGATERTRLGVRYPELLAFIIAAL